MSEENTTPQPQEENVSAPETTETPAAEETKEEAATPAQPEIRSGMIVRIHEKIKDVNAKGEERSRVQVFEGMVLGTKGQGIAKTVRVQKDSGGVLVEKIFPLSSPNIEKIEIVRQFKVRRKKLVHLRSPFKRKMKEVK